jgi:hypothetical protein
MGIQRFTQSLSSIRPTFRKSKYVNYIYAEGGSVALITDGGVRYKLHTFTSDSDFEIKGGTSQIEYLIVGGGGDGSPGSNFGGGGGAGRFQIGSVRMFARPTPNEIDVAGPIQSSFINNIYSQSNFSRIVTNISSVNGNSGITITGGSSGNGFGGGAGQNSAPGRGGGGGGSGGAGSTNAGTGTNTNFSGSNSFIAGGGGGAFQTNNRIPGAAGGGAGGFNGGAAGIPATANTGSGGGGAINSTRGNGATGLIRVRYRY